MLLWSVRMVVLVGLPAAVALILLAEPMLTTLFQYGEMLSTDVAMASYSLQAYALGLLAFMLVKVLATGYFAQEDTKNPVRIGIYAMVTNMVLNLVFVLLFHLLWQIGHVGLALATSASACLNAALLYRGLRRSEQMPSMCLLRPFFLQVVLGLALMSLALVVGTSYWSTWTDWSAWHRIWRLAVLCLLGGGLYLFGLVVAGARPRDFQMRSA